MSRNWLGSVIPGCGRQSLAVGAHGKMESNGATGNWVFARGGWDGPVDVELPDVERVGRGAVRAVVVLRADQRDSSAGLGLPGAVDVGGQQPVADLADRDAVGVEQEAERPGVRVTGEHP